MRIEDLAKEFPDDVRRRGAAYDRARAVRVSSHSVTTIRAIVTGMSRYAVRLHVAGKTLSLGCSCPYFESSGPCKHLWATALAADARRWLAPMAGYARVQLEDEDGDGGGDGDEDEDEDEDGDAPEGDVVRHTRSGERAAPLQRTAGRSPTRRAPAPPAWQTLFVGAASSLPRSSPSIPALPANLLYVIDAEQTRVGGELVLTLRTRPPKKGGGTWSKDRRAGIAIEALETISDERDRRALPLIQAAASVDQTSLGYGHSYGYSGQFATEARLPPALAGELMPLLSETGRLFVRALRDAEPLPARYDGDPPWDFHLVLRRHADRPGGEVSGVLRRGDERVDLTAPLVVTRSGWVVFPDRVGTLRHFGAFDLLASLRGHPAVPVGSADETAFMHSLYALAALPRLELPEDLTLREVAVPARPFLKLGGRDTGATRLSAGRVGGQLAFCYDDIVVAASDPRAVLARIEQGHLVRRDPTAEAAALAALGEAGFRRPRDTYYQHPDPDRFEIAPAKLPAAVSALIQAGWRVEAEGRLYRQAGRFDLSVSSGVDWFDLDARVDFDGVAVALPELLRALGRGERTIVLGDGSLGMMPEDWLRQYGLLAGMGSVEGDRLRFGRAQVGLLDALLAAAPAASVDRLFVQARDELRRFEGVVAEKAPATFRGALRPYQEIGLGWLSFLRRFGFGGCLADDMGLGKTVQVLAMLAARPREPGRPSLVVAPKSLVWNWQQEAARFVPDLRVLAHVGPDRAADARAFRTAAGGADLVITTYGLLRKDVPFLREIELDHVILDEAQAVKNADSESAKAARLLRGQHRLALSGTPIENHIGELWSLVEFLNPGMLGTARAFAGAATGTRTPDRETLALLARALRPFFLRRTKAEVAPELPAKHEETIFCEMEPEQRRLYDELRAHYRASLLGRIDSEGMGRAKLQVLEALLRLRQAACHPALIDGKRADQRSGKIDVLFARLDEIRQEGHKALVFSQFTSFLALVRARLDAAGIPYEYLDGRTRDREARVRHFQTDAACPLFLISLKAGGVGLNLTAADYVFILDPWWNPAVEAQAVDRAHRIGQDKHVFVYRLLCRDSVEEKVAALQEQKRGLAEAVINADGSLIQKLDRETLEALLS